MIKKNTGVNTDEDEVMRMLAALAGFVALIGLAAPAQADPGGDDANFLGELGKARVPFRDGPAAIAVGKRACQLMDQGNSEYDVIKSVSTSNPGFTMADATKFTTIAVRAYCPQHSDEAPTPPPPPPSPNTWPEFPWPGLPAA